MQAVGSLCAVAAEAGLTPARFALAWCLRNKNVSSVILGASRVEQLEENLKAADDVAKITPEVDAAVNRALAPFCV